MTDIIDRQTRSKMMSGIRGKNTKPEIIIRKGLHAQGYRFRLHDKQLPGKPDLVLRKYKAVIFIHGCFWHGHDCHLFKWPKTRPEFWKMKIESNKQRDKEYISTLQHMGWRVLVVWECALKGKTRMDPGLLLGEIGNWLENGPGNPEIRGLDNVHRLG